MEKDLSLDVFELRRHVDDLVYRFRRAMGPTGQIGFKREDSDFWIYRHTHLGWIQAEWGRDEVYGRPWDQLAEQSKAGPPEGIWVNRKASKSYVYDLVHVPSGSEWAS
ncbi:MAG: hypothetical protein AAFR93_05810 [Pseudomonadota bacterium]